MCLIFFAFLSIQGCDRTVDDSQFYLLNGEQKRLSDYSDGWLLINFWAEWCKPCLEEVPELNEVYHAEAELGASLLAFSYDPVDNEQLAAAKDKFNIQYPIVATDPSPVVPFKRPAKLPAMLFISPQGKVFGPLYGKQDIQTIRKTIKQIKQTE